MELAFEAFPGRTLHVLLFVGVTNAAELQALLLKGAVEPEVALVNARLVAGTLALHVAANNAVAAHTNGSLRTRTLHSELVWSLAGSKHISEGLKRFGVAPECDALLVARFDATTEEVAAARALVAGREVALEELPGLVDGAAVQKHYKATQVELTVGTLEDVAVSRISMRDVL